MPEISPCTGENSSRLGKNHPKGLEKTVLEGHTGPRIVRVPIDPMIVENLTIHGISWSAKNSPSGVSGKIKPRLNTALAPSN